LVSVVVLVVGSFAHYIVLTGKFERSFTLHKTENVLTPYKKYVTYSAKSKTEVMRTSVWFLKLVKENNGYYGLVVVNAPETQLIIRLVPGEMQKFRGLRLELKYDIARAKILGLIPEEFKTNFRVELTWPGPVVSGLAPFILMPPIVMMTRR
jgi:hypothetical protein